MLIHVFHSGAIPGSTGYFGYTLKRAINHRKAATKRPSQASPMMKTNPRITANEKMAWTTSDADAPPMTLKTVRIAKITTAPTGWR